MLTLDGGHGEGGGQVLRSACTLAVLLGRPVEVENIRAGRKQPGLRPQHAGLLRFLAHLTDGAVDGAEPGSTRIRFEPGVAEAGDHEWDIGTAGSITLFLQAALPVLALTPGRSRLAVTGGTDVTHSPTFDWFKNVYVDRMRPVADSLELHCPRRGFYPKGGGHVILDVDNKDFDRDLESIRGRVHDRLGESRVEQRHLVLAEGTSVAEERLSERDVAPRQAAAASRFFEERELLVPRMTIRTPGAHSVGTALSLWFEDDDGNRIGGDALGEIATPAEDVGLHAARDSYEDLLTGATVDRHLADQWVMWVALGAGAVRYPRMTGHLETDTWTCRRFLGNDVVRLDGGLIRGQDE